MITPESTLSKAINQSMATNITTAPISLVSQANDALFSLLEKTKFEHIKLPVDSNTLTFSPKGLDLKFRELTLCSSQDKSTYSPDLLNNLIFFYFALTGYYLVTLVIVLNYYHSGALGEAQVLTQLLPFSVLTGLFYGVLVMTKKRRKWLLNIRALLTPLIALLVLYLSLTDKQVMEAVFSFPQNELFAGHNLVTLLFLYLSVLVTMYHFACVAVISSVAIISEIAVKVGVGTLTKFMILEEMAVLIVFALMLCFTVYLREFRSKQIFYQLQKEEQAHRTTQTQYPMNQIEAEFKTEIEKAADICDNIRKTIKEASAVIIYKDIRAKLKEVLSKIEDLRNKIVRGVFTEQVELEMSQGDSENEKFIKQNYMEKMLISRKNTLLSKRTLNDIPLSAGLPNHAESEVNAELASTGRAWNFDIWAIYERTGQSVFLIGNYLISKWEFSTNYGLNEEAMNSCFRKIEASYRSNPFHNACHAAEVCHSLVYFINHSDLIKNISGLDLLSSMLAALSHDISHPGLTNRYLILTQDDLAITYNDTSVLENMHASRLFHILKEQDSDIFQEVPIDDIRIIRKLIIAMVLETDMSKHFASVGRFRSISKKPGINFSKQEDKFFCLAFALKCADAGYCAKSIDLHVEWVQRAAEEFFLQGDLERELGMEISSYCDRNSTDVAKSQSAFLNVICRPMFETWTEFLKSEEINYSCKQQIDRNIEYWENRARGRRSVTPDQAKGVKLLRFFSVAEKREDL